MRHIDPQNGPLSSMTCDMYMTYDIWLWPFLFDPWHVTYDVQIILWPVLVNKWPVTSCRKPSGGPDITQSAVYKMIHGLDEPEAPPPRPHQQRYPPEGTTDAAHHRACACDVTNSPCVHAAQNGSSSCAVSDPRTNPPPCTDSPVPPSPLHQPRLSATSCDPATSRDPPRPSMRQGLSFRVLQYLYDSDPENYDDADERDRGDPIASSGDAVTSEYGDAVTSEGGGVVTSESGDAVTSEAGGVVTSECGSASPAGSMSPTPGSVSPMPRSAPCRHRGKVDFRETGASGKMMGDNILEAGQQGHPQNVNRDVGGRGGGELENISFFLSPFGLHGPPPPLPDDTPFYKATIETGYTFQSWGNFWVIG